MKKFNYCKNYKPIYVGLILLMPLMLSSCAANSYIEPYRGQPIAMVKGVKSGTSIVNFEISRVMEIDGKNNPSAYDYDKEVAVVPGTHIFLINTVFTHGFFSDRNEANIEVSATLKAGHYYQVRQLVQYNQVTVGIVDINGKNASGFNSSPYRIQYDPPLPYNLSR